MNLRDAARRGQKVVDIEATVTPSTNGDAERGLV
jgi:hypothetical protein